VRCDTPSTVATLRVEPWCVASKNRSRPPVLEGMGRVRNARCSPSSICPTSAPKRSAGKAGTAPPVGGSPTPPAPVCQFLHSRDSACRRGLQASAVQGRAPIRPSLARTTPGYRRQQQPVRAGTLTHDERLMYAICSVCVRDSSTVTSIACR
jgi:hypothetical protein